MSTRMRSIWATEPSRTRWPQLLLPVIALLVAWLPVEAQQVALINFLDDAPAHLSPPTFAAQPQAVAIDAAILAQLRPDSPVRIQVDQAKFALLQIEQASAYLNGDRSIRAQGWDGDVYYSLALTVGDTHLFGHLNTSRGIWQLYATAADAGFTGWLYQPDERARSGNAFFNDYVIPDTNNDRVLSKPQPTPTLPLKSNQTGTPPATDSQDATTATINQDNFQITQGFNRDPVIVGNKIEAQVVFENTSNEWHRDLSVDFYFLLENTKLHFAPPQCQQQLSLSSQEVLHCELGDFAPGERKSLMYIVNTDTESKPYVLSTAIIGELRLDSFVNVVDDVLTDSDGDTISDFNESLQATDPFDSASVNLDSTTIDVMALYTAGAEDLFPNGVETRINQLISVANQVYSDSAVKINLRPVYMGRVDYNDADDMDTALNHLISKTDPAFAEVDAVRSAYGADLVMLFRPLESAVSRCGLAPVGGFNTNGDFTAPAEREFAYSHIAIDCPLDIVVAHELGHNMGLTHSHLEDGTGGTFNFSTGYGVQSQFATVMAFPEAFSTETHIALFSNPDVDCLGFACGIDSSDEFGANAALSLNIVRHQIAGYYPSVVPELPLTEVASVTGIPTAASIAVGATSDNGLSYANTFNATDVIDLATIVEVDEAHVGEPGVINVLVGIGNLGFVQPDGEGQLVAWDGTLEGLLPQTGSGPLRARERLSILDGYQLDAGLIGHQILVYVAYQVPERGELVYTIMPLVLNVVPAPAAPLAAEAEDTTATDAEAGY